LLLQILKLPIIVLEMATEKAGKLALACAHNPRSVSIVISDMRTHEQKYFLVYLLVGTDACILPLVSFTIDIMHCPLARRSGRSAAEQARQVEEARGRPEREVGRGG
jgi:hypothetical protein